MITWKSKSSLVFLLIHIVLLVSCHRYAISMRKKKEEAPKVQVPPDMGLQDLRSFKTPDEYLKHLNALKAEGAGALFSLYRTKGRTYLRQGFRYFRDHIIDQKIPEAIQPAKYPETCTDLKKETLFNVGEYGDIRPLLGSIFLSTLGKDQAKVFNSSLPEKLDEVYQLVFFELGINIEGVSTFEGSESSTTMTSDVKWMVIHERTEASELKERDSLETRFRFSRTSKAGVSDAIEIDAQVVDRNLPVSASTALPAIVLSYQQLNVSQDSITNTLTVTQGTRSLSGEWSDKMFSREVSITFNPNDAASWTLTEIQKLRPSSETKRTLSHRKDASELCESGSRPAPKNGEQEAAARSSD